MIVNNLNQLKEMVGEMVPPIKQALNMGLEINIRNVNTSVFIDLSVSGMIGQQVQATFSQVNLNNVGFSGNANFHFNTGFVPTMLLTKTLEEVIQAATNLKIEGNGEFYNVKTILNAAINIMMSSAGGHIPNKLKPLIMLLKSCCALRKYDFNLKYDAKTLMNLIIEAINLSGHDSNEPQFQKILLSIFSITNDVPRNGRTRKRYGNVHC